MVENVFISYQKYVKTEPKKTSNIFIWFICVFIVATGLASTVFGIISDFYNCSCYTHISLILGIICIVLVILFLAYLKIVDKNEIKKDISYDENNNNDRKSNNNEKIFLNDRQKELKKILISNDLYSINGIDYLLFRCERSKIKITQNPLKVFWVLMSSFIIPFFLAIINPILDGQSGNMDELFGIFKAIVLIAFTLLFFIIGLMILVDYALFNRDIKNKFENDLRYLKTKI